MEEILSDYNLTLEELKFVLNHFGSKTMESILRRMHKSPDGFSDIYDDEEDFEAYEVWGISQKMNNKLTQD